MAPRNEAEKEEEPLWPECSDADRLSIVLKFNEDKSDASGSASHHHNGSGSGAC